MVRCCEFNILASHPLVHILSRNDGASSKDFHILLILLYSLIEIFEFNQAS